MLARAVVTGEESDDTIHTARSKLFAMVDGGWVERGTGVLKLNRTINNDGGEKVGARIGTFLPSVSLSYTSFVLTRATRRKSVMRADATHRLLLNATLFPKFSIEVNQEKYVRFAIIEGVEPISYMLRVRSALLSFVLLL